MIYPDDYVHRCQRCKGPIDAETFIWFLKQRFKRNKKPATPKICGRCLVIALDELAIEAGIVEVSNGNIE